MVIIMVRVTAKDVAGNVTVTDYDFIKDTASPALPVATLTIEGVNSGAAFAGDGVINREEIGYGTAGSNLKIGVALEDPQGTKIVSVKVNDFEVQRPITSYQGCAWRNIGSGELSD